MIGLSPLPTIHPETFQRLSVRSSTVCYHPFNLTMGRSPGFASTATDSSPCSDSLSLRLRDSSLLTSPVTVTRRLIMQKARCHAINDAPTACKHPVSGSVSPWYAQSFSPFPHGTLPYRSSTVFSLGRWCCQLQRESLRLPPTQDPQPTPSIYPYGTLTPCG